jgi:Flp pilus assembly pilin Flp
MNMGLKICTAIRNLARSEDGQDLVEYSLTLAMVAFGCVTTMGYLASSIDNVFDAVCQILSTNIT